MRTRVDYDRVRRQPRLVEVIEEASHVVIDGLDAPEVPLHVPLVLELRQLVARLEGKVLARLAVDEAQLGHIVRHRDLARRDEGVRGEFELADLVAAFRLREPEVVVAHVGLDAHLGDGGRLRAVLVVVRKGLGQLDRIAVQVAVLRVALPRAVRRLVVAHGEERSGRIPVPDKVDRFVRDDVGGVAHLAVHAALVDEERVEVGSLAGQDVPRIEAGRFVRLALAEVPLADHGGLVSVRAEMLGDVWQILCDLGVERRNVVHICRSRWVSLSGAKDRRSRTSRTVVSSGQDGCATRRADRVGHVAVVEAHAFFGEPVEVRRRVDGGAVAADRFRGMVVRHNEQDVGRGYRRGRHGESLCTQEE